MNKSLAERKALLNANAENLLAVVKRVRALEESTKGKGLLDLNTHELRELYNAARSAIARIEQTVTQAA